MNFAIICNPGNRRCQFFKTAVVSQGFEVPLVISYKSILHNEVDLEDVLKNIAVLKIESFGEDFGVEKEIIALASHLNEDFISVEAITNLPFDKGRIQYSKQLYLGCKILLHRIQKAISKSPNLKVMNAVDDILLMFNKIEYHQYLTTKGIPVIPAIYNVQSFDDLLAKMKRKSWNRVFIKPNFSSSASGVIAFRINGDKMQAITSVELVEENGEIKLYNSLRIRTYTDLSKIKAIVNILVVDDLIVEKWIPKASNENGSYDFRIVTIKGKAMHTIARQSRSPLTNLHLGNKRGDLNIIKEEIGEEIWNKLLKLAADTSKLLPQSLYAGLDILLSKNHQKQYVIEANSFGDLLPNLYIDGLDTYRTQIKQYV